MLIALFIMPIFTAEDSEQNKTDSIEGRNLVFLQIKGLPPHITDDAIREIFPYDVQNPVTNLFE